MRTKIDNTIFSRAQQDIVRLFLKMQLKHDTNVVHFSWLRRQGKQLNLAQCGTNAYEIHARDFTRSFGKASEKEASGTRVEYPSVACTKVQKRKQPRMSPVDSSTMPSGWTDTSKNESGLDIGRPAVHTCTTSPA